MYVCARVCVCVRVREYMCVRACTYVVGDTMSYVWYKDILCSHQRHPHTHTYTNIYVYIHIYVSARVCVCERACAPTCACMRVHAQYMRACIYFMYTCVRLRLYVCARVGLKMWSM